MADYKTEHLGGGNYVCVSREHTFGTDAVLLADFASPRSKDTAYDLGTGCGIIPLLWVRNNMADKIVGVELQKQGFEQACRSAEISGAEAKVKFINADIRDIKKFLPHGQADVVTMNPPYKAADSGIESMSPAEKIARHEVECRLTDVTDAAAHLLKFGGRLCLCNRPERLSDTIIAMKQTGIEPKRLRFVVKRPETKPWLFLIEGKKGSKPYMSVEPMLIMYGGDGGLSDEVMKIYGEYKENCK